MRYRIAVACVGVLSAGWPCLAQQPGNSQERQGFWIGFGAGYGSAIASGSCEGCSGGRRQGGLTGFLKLGGTVNPRFLLGAEANAWTKSVDEARLTFGSVAGTVTFYPQVSSGFFLKGGGGLSHTSTSVSGISVSLNKTGWGLLAGLGYDLRVGRNVSITPCFNYYYGKPGDISYAGVVLLPGWSQNVLDFAVGVTFH